MASPRRNHPRRILSGDLCHENEAYNLSGLSFTNDVTGSTAPFVASGQSTGTLAWDKNQVMMNGNPFSFAAFIPQFPKDEPVTVKAPFVNTTQEDKTITLTWKQYNWDGCGMLPVF